MNHFYEISFVREFSNHHFFGKCGLPVNNHIKPVLPDITGLLAVDYPAAKPAIREKP